MNVFGNKDKARCQKGSNYEPARRDAIAILLVSLAQIIGLIVSVCTDGPAAAVVMGIAGFAAIINLFLPSGNAASWVKSLKIVAAVCGVFLIVLAFMKVGG